MGRPTLLNAELQAGIVADLEQGCTLDIAAECAGITATTIHCWMAKGREGMAPYAEFEQAVTRARGNLKKRLISEVRSGEIPGGKGSAPLKDWKARLELLKALDPHTFGDQRTVNVKLEKELEKVVDKLEKHLAPDVFRAVMEVLAMDVVLEANELPVSTALDVADGTDP